VESNGKSSKTVQPERAKGQDAVRQTERSALLHIVSSAFGEAGLLVEAVNPHYGESTMSDEVFHAALDEVMSCMRTAIGHLLTLHDTVCKVSDFVEPSTWSSASGPLY
jgi:hypothetical protein